MTTKEEITLKVVEQRVESRILKRSKYVKTKWYQFFAYTFPFYYVFVLLEKLKLVHQRPYRVDTNYKIVAINGLGGFTDSFLIEAINKEIEEQKEFTECLNELKGKEKPSKDRF